MPSPQTAADCIFSQHTEGRVSLWKRQKRSQVETDVPETTHILNTSVTIVLLWMQPAVNQHWICCLESTIRHCRLPMQCTCVSDAKQNIHSSIQKDVDDDDDGAAEMIDSCAVRKSISGKRKNPNTHTHREATNHYRSTQEHDDKKKLLLQ